MNIFCLVFGHEWVFSTGMWAALVCRRCGYRPVQDGNWWQDQYKEKPNE